MVDLSFLEKFTKGNPDKKKRYISLYLDVAPKTFDRMKQNLEEDDYEQLRINAHSLKPQADFMGISELKNVLIEIENEVNNRVYTTLNILFEKARSLHKEAEMSLNNTLNDLTDQA